MSGNLLDTNVILFSVMDDSRLSPNVRSAVAEGPNVMSVASYWEIVIKSMKGKLDVGEPRIWWTRTLHELAAVPLPIRSQHVEAVLALPAIHRDLFDRLILGAAMSESLTLLTTDVELTLYASERLTILS